MLVCFVFSLENNYWDQLSKIKNPTDSFSNPGMPLTSSSTHVSHDMYCRGEDNASTIREGKEVII